ncbi:hypothetical protein [Actinobacillus pleuropneumoniae]|uniref:hypothetical protein n=1 Tax=Actinobacillus pleuropneumoniae TaxID=715 RepID=UPI003D06A8A1
MISEQDKQAILNGALGVTRDGELKAKFLGRNISRDFMWCFYDIDGDVYGIQCFPCGFNKGEFQQSDLDIVGLWKNKPEPFDLEKALAGEPVLLRDGSKAYIFHCINDGFAKKHNIGYQLLGVIVDSLEGKQLTRSWAKSGIFNEVNPYPDFDIIGMWREPEPQLSNNSLQLPKPLTEPLNNDDNYFTLASRNGKYVIDDWRWKDKTSDHIFLREARIYKTKDDVIKIIETITGKPYEDR